MNSALAIKSNPQDTNALVKNLRALAADSLVLFVKVSALHYLVQGKDFEDTHRITDDFYNSCIYMYDWANERLVQKEYSPIQSIAEALENSSVVIGEKKNKYSDMEVCKELISYFLQIKNRLVVLREISNRIKDSTTEDYCINKIRHIEKEVWMLKSRTSTNVIK